MQKPFLPVILGTAREGRQSQNVMQFVLTELKQRDDLTTELIDVREYLSSATEGGDAAATERLLAIAARADGFIIVCPEYNHSFPGELKIMLDNFGAESARKPVGICSVSSGGYGGVRMVDHLMSVFVELSLVPIHKVVQFATVESLFDEHGVFTDPTKHQKKLRDFTDEMIWFANALGAARRAM